jgi:hypothetical protein
MILHDLKGLRNEVSFDFRGLKRRAIISFILEDKIGSHR